MGEKEAQKESFLDNLFYKDPFYDYFDQEDFKIKSCYKAPSEDQVVKASSDDFVDENSANSRVPIRYAKL